MQKYISDTRLGCHGPRRERRLSKFLHAPRVRLRQRTHWGGGLAVTNENSSNSFKGQPLPSPASWAAGPLKRSRASGKAPTWTAAKLFGNKNKPKFTGKLRNNPANEDETVPNSPLAAIRLRNANGQCLHPVIGFSLFCFVGCHHVTLLECIQRGTFDGDV